jgi:drug/metabolite transporter (DMT)-like permease
MQRFLPLLATLGLSLLCVAADYLFKLASELPRPYRSPHFAVGVVLYGSSAFGWVYVLRHTKLATVGALFCVVVVVLLAVVGVFAFRESLSTSELIGLGCAVAALILLGRFA